MLDHLAAEDASDGRIGNRLQIIEQALLHHVEALFPAEQEHVRIAFHAARGNSIFLHQFQELATAASQINHILPASENVQVAPLPILDILLRAPEALLKEEVVKLRFGWDITAEHWRRLRYRRTLAV